MPAAPEHSSIQFEPGSIIGGYVIEGVIGIGGMGVVYRATQLALERVVALKVISPAIVRDEQFRSRFMRESRVAAALEHPNVVSIYEAGETPDGQLYLAMSHVEGEDLYRWVERAGGLAPVTAAKVVSQVAAALDHAHAHGMVHRDVKPANVLIGPDERVYLTDFGLVKPFGTEDKALTQAGMFVGTIDYVAPEQVQGSAVDARVDVYALGGLLYFALTGSPPFPRESPLGTLYAHMNEPPPLPSSVTDVGPDLDGVVRKAMAKNPGDRYPSAGELALAAEAAAMGAPLPAIAPSVAPELGVAGTVAAEPVASPPTPIGPYWGEADTSATVPGAATPPPRPAEPQPAPAQPTSFQAVPESPEQRIPLVADFRYIHHPLPAGPSGLRLLGSDDAIRSLTERILHSDGGSFLITGFRGVGKTTVVEQVLARLRDRDDRELVDVKLNVARPKRVDQLMFEIIRRLFERLEELHVLERLDPDVPRELLLAYMRTSMSFNETRRDATQSARNVSLGTEALGRLLAPGIEWSRGRSEELATQASFLAYTDADVEHDFLRILQGLNRERPRSPAPPAATGPRRLGRRRPPPPPPPPPWRGRIVVVLDELDKLTAEPEGKESLNALLSGLKNLLTASGVHFVFVGGGDLHNDWLLDSRRGNSVLESVFGWHLYVPCVRGAAGQLLDCVVAPEARGNRMLETLHDYLEYKARGVPRLLVMELNSFVQWRDGRPEIVLSGADLARVEFYADLERTLCEFLRGDGDEALFSVPIDEDRWRLGAYYLTDWILRTRGGSFTVKEIVDSVELSAIEPQLALSEGKVERLLEQLVRHEKLRVRGGAGETFYGDVAEAQEAVYRVNEDLDVQLSAFARVNERERAELAPQAAETGGFPVMREPWVDTDAGPVVLDRYELLDEIDRSGSGRVYRGHDRIERREVAVKLVDVPQLATNAIVRARFLRKGQLATELDHRNIVPTHAVFAGEDEPLGIAMDFVEGIPLEQLLGQTKLLAIEAVALVTRLADALDHLHGRGLARLDLKPSRIMLDHEQEPVILDLGLIKEVDEDAASHALTAAGVRLGTPLYAAPEQLTGAPVDIRADLCSLGLILFEMITGRRARGEEENLTATLFDAVNQDVDLTPLEGVASPELCEVVRTCVARDPVERFETPAALLAALRATPEAAARSAIVAHG